MALFFETLIDPQINFLLYSFLIALVGSLAFGMMGTFVVIKRISYIAGAISHCILGGIGLGMYLNNVHQLTWFTPFVGSILMALFSAIIIGIFNLYFKEREDSLIGSLWAFGMGIGLILIYITPGYVDPMNYLFGSIIMVGKSDFIVVLILDIVIILTTVLFYNKLVAICFDEEFARIRGINTKFYYFMLLCLIALTIVLLINIVGIVMIIALLTIPSAMAGLFSKKIWHMMLFSILICLLVNIVGLVSSFSLDLPTGPTIITFSTCIYFLSVLILKKRFT